jgi:hypothetical protein
MDLRAAVKNACRLYTVLYIVRCGPISIAMAQLGWTKPLLGSFAAQED